MNEGIDGLSSVIVLEAGAEWPKWVAEYQRRAPNSIVVAHASGESMTDWVLRVARHLNKMQGELRIAVVACAPSVEETHLAAREQICRILLHALAKSGSGEVVLAANVQGSDGSKHAIFELAGALCEGLSDNKRVVRVRFSNGGSESGVVPTLAAAPSAEPGLGSRRIHG